MAAEGPANSTEYITHHLTHLTVGKGFWSFHVDTIFMSVLLGLVTLALFYSVARKATPGVPGKWQAFVEILVDFIDNTVKEVFHLDRNFLAPLALTIFVWVFLMNAMDLLPLDLPGKVAGWFGLTHWRAVPTADVNTTFAMSLTVLRDHELFYSVKAKGAGGYLHELFTAPFGATPAALDPELRAEPGRAAVEARFARDATVRQHVRRRAGIHADRAARRQLLHLYGRQHGRHASARSPWAPPGRSSIS